MMKFKLVSQFLFLPFMGFIFCFSGIFAYGLCNKDDNSLLWQMKQNLSFSSHSYYDSIGQSANTRLSSWNSSTDCCSWKGVTCNLSDGHVIGLDLAGQSITSGIDNTSTLFKLKHLISLSLADNRFNSSIPPGLDRLANLSYLNLSFSGFRGQIPIEISRMKRLVSLDLTFFSWLDSPMKLENPDLGTLCKDLSELRELILDGVNISNNGIAWARALSSTLPNLQVLSIAGCYISGPLHPSLIKLKSLSKLRLDFNNISAQIPDFFGNFSMLTSLSLRICNLLGKFPERIFLLPQLRSVDLSYNRNLQGTLPDFPKNASLEKLILCYSNFSGNLPESIGFLTKLKYLDLSNNILNGVVPTTLFSLPLLEMLNLKHNHFSGPISEFSKGLSIFNVSNLKVLKLSYNNLHDTLELKSFQNLRNLDELDLSGNDLWIKTSGVDSSLFPQVGVLLLGSCNLSTFPEFLRNQSRLKFLDLFNNSIQGKIPNWIGEIGNGSLVYLNISVNMLEISDRPLTPDSFQSLRFVDLHSNLLNGTLPIMPPSAYFLDLSHNFLNGEIPSSICIMKDLISLDLSNNRLSGEIPQCLSGLSSLVYLNLPRNNFHGVIQNIFPSECKLRTLDLNGNNVDGVIPKSLANCTDLEVLNLGNNGLVGSFPSWLEELLKLRILILRSNKLHGPIKYQRANYTFSKLHIVDLSSNNFSGSLPSELFRRLKVMKTYDYKVHTEYVNWLSGYQLLGYDVGMVYYQDVTITSKGRQTEFVKILTSFASIDLSNNQFNGEIPQVIGELISLHALNLSHNALTGTIPSSLGNLKQLESLDFSKNKLHGRIPKELADLTFLQVLNLSFNQLMGRIPEGRQLQTFPEGYFEGNNLLCGPPLSKICSNVVKEEPSTKYSNKKCKFSMFKNCQDDGKYNWQLISIALGYGIGLGISFCLVSFWRPWNRLCVTISKRILKMD